jgi:hypothetical protein
VKDSIPPSESQVDRILRQMNAPRLNDYGLLEIRRSSDLRFLQRPVIEPVRPLMSLRTSPWVR